LPPYFPDTATVRRDVARHYDNVAIMDWEVGLILAGLEEDGLAESTIVIWTTDHGDGLPRSKRELYDSGIKVPMIIRWPEQYRPPGVQPGAMDMRLISFVDIAPTILRLAGAVVPDYLQGRDFLQGEPRHYVYASRDRIDEVRDRQRAVRDRQYKYIRSWHPDQPGGHHLRFRDNMDMMREFWILRDEGKLTEEQALWFEPPGEERLFRLDNDPWELHDISSDPAYRQVLIRLRGELDSFLARTGDWSDESEAEMIARFQPAGEQQLTSMPTAAFAGGRLTLATETPGASLGYRIDEGRWQLYTGPVEVPPGARVTAKAVRYGFSESDEVAVTAP
ncbi:MAG: sulfatase-like hydrolase/transferase, partial [Halioglobus sp.]